MIALTNHRPEVTFRQPRPLEPRQFCEKYARLTQSEYGYKGNWVRLLAYVLDISPKTVETWGNPPDFPECSDKYKRELARIDALLKAETLLKEHGLSQEYLKQIE